MAKKKPSLTAQYNRVRKNLENRIRKMQERGYMFNEKQLNRALPARPKHITKKTIETLKKRNERYLSENSSYLDPDTGRITSGRRGREIEYSKRGKEAAERRKEQIADIDALINGMRQLINAYREIDGHMSAAARLESALNVELATDKNRLYKRLAELNREDRDSLLSDVEFFLKYSPEDNAENAWSDKILPILTGRALTMVDLVSDYRG